MPRALRDYCITALAIYKARVGVFAFNHSEVTAESIA